jgi:hypothetical protein
VNRDAQSPNSFTKLLSETLDVCTDRRSVVACRLSLNGVQGVAGSNPAAPVSKCEAPFGVVRLTNLFTVRSIFRNAFSHT